MKIAITGHRPNKLDNDYDLKSPLIGHIKSEILRILIPITLDESKDPLTLITGMALGIDTLFALIAIELNIPFIAAIPCINHSSKWTYQSSKLYDEILANPLCNRILVYTGEYNNTCMQERNEWMVNNCDLLIAVWDNSPGGTANCVKYAKSQNKEIIFINPMNCRDKIYNNKIAAEILKADRDHFDPLYDGC